MEESCLPLRKPGNGAPCVENEIVMCSSDGMKLTAVQWGATLTKLALISLFVLMITVL